MKYFSVKNLEHYQHYKDRNPPWVKLYYSLLDDPEFIVLDEVNRHRYIMCTLIASRLNNRIPNDPAYLARVMRLVGDVDVTPLIQAGFLLAAPKRRSNSPQSQRKKNADSEIETKLKREKKTEGERERKGGTTISSIFQFSSEIRAIGKELGLFEREIDTEQEKFRDHYLSNGAVKQDWDAAARNWVRKCLKFGPQRGGVIEEA